MCLLSWRKTNFLCIISILSGKSMSKLINVNCLHFIGCQNYTNVLYKSRFISNSSHCSTTILSKHITSALTAVKDHVMKYSETTFSNSNVNYFGSLKTLPMSSKSCDCVNFQGSQVSSFDFSTLYTSLPHDLIKAKLLSHGQLVFQQRVKILPLYFTQGRIL